MMYRETKDIEMEGEIASTMTPPTDQMAILEYENKLLRAFVGPRYKGEYSPTVAYRMPLEIRQAIDVHCRSENETVTSFINRAVVKYLVDLKRENSRKGRG